MKVLRHQDPAEASAYDSLSAHINRAVIMLTFCLTFRPLEGNLDPNSYLLRPLKEGGS